MGNKDSASHIAIADSGSRESAKPLKVHENSWTSTQLVPWRKHPIRKLARQDVSRALADAIALTASLRAIAGALNVDFKRVHRMCAEDGADQIAVADLVTCARAGWRDFALEMWRRVYRLIETADRGSGVLPSKPELGSDEDI